MKNELFITFFKVGYIKKAPGTFGTMAGLLVGAPIGYFSQSILFSLSLLLTIIAIDKINIYEKQSNVHDAKHIVIDEVIGIWIALSIAGVSIVNIILSFILFRIYDITKPSVIGLIDKKVKGGLGVVGDDLGAGILAGISTIMIIQIYNIII